MHTTTSHIFYAPFPPLPPMPSTDFFWTIPLIQDAIARYLDKRSFSQCIQVSKALYDAFIPFVWRTIQPHDSRALSRFLASPALSRHRRHVRTLNLMAQTRQEWQQLLDLTLLGPYPNLMHLTLNDPFPVLSAGKDPFSDEELLKQDLTLLVNFLQAHSPTLQRLSMPGQGKLVPEFKEFLARGMKPLEGVREMYLGWTEPESGENLIEVFGAFTRLQKLVLSGESMQGSSPLDWWTGKVQESRIQHLDIAMHGPEVDRVILLLLGSCTSLEYLKLRTYVSQGDLPKNLAEVLKDRCRNLRDLDLILQGVNVAQLVLVLDACPSLRRLLFYMPKLYGPAVFKVVQKHGQTLEYLNIYEVEPIRPEDLFYILGNCPRLRVVKVAIQAEQGFDPLNPRGPTIPSPPWVCMGLTSLDLFIEGRPYEACAFGMETLYEQLGRMHQLEEFTLQACIGTKVFTEVFVEGFRGHLAKGLKCLRAIYFSDCREFTLLEVEGILENIVEAWPRLTSFTGLMDHDRGFGFDMKGQQVVRCMREEVERKMRLQM